MGSPWGTTWFRFRATVPSDRRESPLEAVVDLGWTSDSVGGQAEGLVVDKAGRIIKGLHPRNAWVPVTLTDKGKVRFFVEAAANPEILRARSFAPTSLGRKDTADPAPSIGSPAPRSSRSTRRSASSSLTWSRSLGWPRCSRRTPPGGGPSCEALTTRWTPST